MTAKKATMRTLRRIVVDFVAAYRRKPVHPEPTTPDERTTSRTKSRRAKDAARITATLE